MSNEVIARIFRPTKNAMQSGTGNIMHWCLVFELTNSQYREPLVGWVASKDTKKQILLKFTTKNQAIAYAKKNNLEYVIVSENPTVAKKPKFYADNFTRLRGL